MTLPTRKLTNEELERLFRPLIGSIRTSLLKLTEGDPALLFALRRKLAKELIYDERSKPDKRQRLKRQKRRDQGGRCAICNGALPERGSILDRNDAMKGYIRENVRLVCPSCDLKGQVEKGFQ